jgi:O-Antigen ligase
MLQAVRHRMSGPMMRNLAMLLIVAGVAAAIPRMMGPMMLLMEKAAIGSSGMYNIVVLVVIGIAAPLWLFLLIRGDYLYALGLQIAVLPFSFRVANGFGISAYDEGTFVQRISLTTFFIVGFLAWLWLSRVPLRPHPDLRIFERLLVAFAVFTTVSQLANHDIFSALMLSIGGGWQFVFLFYVVCAVVRQPDDIKFVLKSIVIAFVIGIADRMASQGQGFLVEAAPNMAKLAPHAVAGDFVRVGSGAFGFAQSYGGYLSFVSILGLYFVQTEASRIRQVLWVLAVLGLLFEMLNTFTRGATLALLFLFLLLMWKTTRPFFTKILIVSTVVMATWIGSFLLDLATVRNLELNPSFILSDPNSTGRFDLWVQSLPHFFDNWGLGYGIGKPLMFYLQGYGEAVSHNVTLDLSQSVGGIATVLFLAMFAISEVRVFRMSRGAEPGSEKQLAIYLFVGLLAWFFFANSTSTSIVYYYPYEATMIFYIVMFFAVLLSVITNGTKGALTPGSAAV